MYKKIDFIILSNFIKSLSKIEINLFILKKCNVLNLWSGQFIDPNTYVHVYI